MDEGGGMREQVLVITRAVGRIRGAGGQAIHVAAAAALLDRAGIFGGGD